jgi:adenosylhomocysteine nucleosidase
MATGAVTGLAREAEIARSLGLEAAAGAGTTAGTESAIADLIERGVPGLVSFGIAGGLAPGLAPGTLLLPPAVRSLSGDGYWVDVEWHARLCEAARAAALPIIAVGGILGAEAIVATSQAKARLHGETGAIAVDLESHRVAVAAQRARLPFLIFRVIADPADRALPPAALVPLKANGELSPGILVSIVRHPAQVSALLRLASDTRAAFQALRRTGRALRSDLANPYG